MTESLGAQLFRIRWLMRLPIGLFRAGLGFLFGTRLMLLEHVGRKSGEARFVVLEVLTRPNSDELVLASGFGRRAQWFQNLEANPHCHVSMGFRRRVAAVATVLESDKAAEVLARYQEAHPGLWEKLDASMREVQAGNERFELPLVLVRMTRLSSPTEAPNA